MYHGPGCINIGENTGWKAARGRWRLAVHKHTKVHVAVKFNTNPKTAEKEARIHRMLSNKNVLKFFGTASCQKRACILLEFAPGGSLADIIEPYRGLGNSEASHKYFKQLLAGTEYLHEQGVVHRDIKPDNLLIDSDDNLKISDFGLASVFRHHGTEQQQGKWCGTLSYMAPEIYTNQPYQAQPVDVWSCGVVLVYLLTGEVPWDKPQVTNEHCDKYAAWIEGFIYFSPWHKSWQGFVAIASRDSGWESGQTSYDKDYKRTPVAIQAICETQKEIMAWVRRSPNPSKGGVSALCVSVCLHFIPLFFQIGLPESVTRLDKIPSSYFKS